MNSPKKKAVDLSPRRYDLSPGGTIWKNPHLVEKTEKLSDFTFEPVLSCGSGSSFSWDVSTHSSDVAREKADNDSTPKPVSTGAGSPHRRHGASGSSFKTVSISKNTAATDNTSIDDDDRATSSKRGSRGKMPSPTTTIPSQTSGVFEFLENLFCCGFYTTDSPKQKSQKEDDNDFLGKIITCQIITCNCEGCTNCNYPENEGHPTSM